MIRTALAASALLLATAAPASAAPTGHLIWDSDPQAQPTKGRSGTWTPPELFSVRQKDNSNTIRVYGEDSSGWNYISFEMARHDGRPITEGSYTDQRVLVVYQGLGWWDESAEFTVEHVAYDANGHINEFDGAVVHNYHDKPDTTFRAKISFRR